jgi:hypothetical protein
MNGNNHGERRGHGEQKVKRHCSTWLILVAPVVVLSVNTIESGLKKRFERTETNDNEFRGHAKPHGFGV